MISSKMINSELQSSKQKPIYARKNWMLQMQEQLKTQQKQVERLQIWCSKTTSWKF